MRRIFFRSSGISSEPRLTIRFMWEIIPWLAQLHSHIGLASVKKDIEELANSMSVDRARRTQGLRVAD
jgi:hypothetical protein